MTDLIELAFKAVPRKDFVPNYLQAQSDIDAPLPIGFGQTISQPTTVRLMLEWLEAQAGDKVLDIGSGSGWTTALLSKIVGSEGKVYAVEKIPELVEMGRENCRAVGIDNAEFFTAGDEFGLPEKAPFDRILVSAAAEELPQSLLKQLNDGGKIVIPVENDILEIEKEGGDYIIKNHRGFVFVPLVKSQSSSGAV